MSDQSLLSGFTGATVINSTFNQVGGNQTNVYTSPTEYLSRYFSQLSTDEQMTHLHLLLKQLGSILPPNPRSLGQYSVDHPTICLFIEAIDILRDANSLFRGTPLALLDQKLRCHGVYGLVSLKAILDSTPILRPSGASIDGSMVLARIEEGMGPMERTLLSLQLLSTVLGNSIKPIETRLTSWSPSPSAKGIKLPVINIITERDPERRTSIIIPLDLCPDSSALSYFVRAAQGPELGEIEPFPVHIFNVLLKLSCYHLSISENGQDKSRLMQPLSFMTEARAFTTYTLHVYESLRSAFTLTCPQCQSSWHLKACVYSHTDRTVHSCPTCGLIATLRVKFCKGRGYNALRRLSARWLSYQHTTKNLFGTSDCMFPMPLAIYVGGENITTGRNHQGDLHLIVPQLSLDTWNLFKELGSQQSIAVSTFHAICQVLPSVSFLLCLNYDLLHLRFAMEELERWALRDEKLLDSLGILLFRVMDIAHLQVFCKALLEAKAFKSWKNRNAAKKLNLAVMGYRRALGHALDQLAGFWAEQDMTSDDHWVVDTAKDYLVRALYLFPVANHSVYGMHSECEGADQLDRDHRRRCARWDRKTDYIIVCRK